MNCPYCGKEMEKGYINSRDGIVWRRKKSMAAAFDLLASDAVDLGTRKPLGESYVVVYRCADCRKFLIDTENGNHTDSD